MKKISILYIVIICICFFCTKTQINTEQAEESINENDLEKHIITLSFDEFLGRKPFTEGEKKTIKYIKEEFEKIGLHGGDNGNYFQDVPLVKLKMKPLKNIKIETKNGRLNLRHFDDFIASTHRIADKIKIKNSELIFAGYGIVAPEYNWNDYEGIDVKGKTVIVLVNDPGFATQDNSLFKGNTMTYY